MFRYASFVFVWIAIFLLGIVGNQPLAAKTPDISMQLAAGKLSEAEQLLTTHLKSDDDDLARFQLGTVQFLRAVEQLSQDGVRYGVLSNAVALPFLRIGGLRSDNTTTQPVTYDDVRGMLERFQSGVMRAEATLAKIHQQDLKWRLNLREVCVDLDGDGQIGEQENIDTLFQMLGRRRLGEENVPPTIVGFDSADVFWLRGYNHVLMGLLDMVLAYDQSELFERTAHLVFRNPQTEFALKRQKVDLEPSQRNPGMEDIYDVIAMIHLINFELQDKDRLVSAREHLLSMIDLSRQSWQLIQSETDDDNEWIPGENQKSVIEGVQMDKERIRSWHAFLQEAEAVLKGDKLVPFWRTGFSGGINLAKMFTEPRDFDLVLWVQGTDALPYLEEGELSQPATWTEFQRVFRGEFVGFAFWIN